jgi:hypothetical protein
MQTRIPESAERDKCTYFEKRLNRIASDNQIIFVSFGSFIRTLLTPACEVGRGANFTKQSLKRLYDMVACKLFQISVYTFASDQTPAASVISHCAYITFPSTQRLSFAPNAPTTAACCQASRYWKTPLAMALSTCMYRHLLLISRIADLRQRRVASRAGDHAPEAARCMSLLACQSRIK